MALVLDASITACWAFDDEDHPAARLTFDRHARRRGRGPLPVGVRGPQHLHGERTAAADHGIRHRRVSAALVSRLRFRVDRSADENAVLRLARGYGLSVYDAAYLELAQREGLPLATLDTHLRRAAAGEGVGLVSGGAAEEPQSTRK